MADCIQDLKLGVVNDKTGMCWQEAMIRRSLDKGQELEPDSVEKIINSDLFYEEDLTPQQLKVLIRWTAMCSPSREKEYA